MTISMYLLLLLALLAANFPFISRRFFGVALKTSKRFWQQLLELVFGFVLVGVCARFLEARAGEVHSQDWEFYVTVACLYLIFAFPAFVWRYFWHSKHQQ